VCDSLGWLYEQSATPGTVSSEGFSFLNERGFGLLFTYGKEQTDSLDALGII